MNAPDHFREDTATARMVRQILGAVAEFEKAQLVARLRAARERKDGTLRGGQAGSGRGGCRGAALARKNPKTGKRRSLRAIAAELAELGHLARGGKSYGAESVRRMLAR